MDVVAFEFPSKELVSEFVKEVAERYGLGALHSWGIFEGGSSGSIWLRAGELSYVVRFTTESRTRDRFLLEHHVVELLDDVGIPVSKIKDAQDTTIVNATNLFGWGSEYAVYEILEGNIYRFSDITVDLLKKAVTTVAIMHETLKRRTLSTNITSHTYLHVALKNLVHDKLDELLRRNYQGRSIQDMEFIRRWWKVNYQEMEKVAEDFYKDPAQIIHGDLNPSNFVLAGSQYGLIDFERVGLAPVEWDLGYALGAWASDQQIMTLAECYKHIRSTYQTCRPDFEWNDGKMVSLLKVFYLSHVFAGLEKPRGGELEGSVQNRTAIFNEGIRGLTTFDTAYAEIFVSD